MKKQLLTVSCLCVVLLFSACKKSDVQAPGNTATTQTASNSLTSAWKTTGNWQSNSQGTVSLFSGNFTDSSITSAVASRGLVLVYKKNSDNTISSLPFLEKGTNSYWFYQVVQGGIVISSSSSSASAKAPSAEQSFSYFIITDKQLTDLLSNGQTINSLMQLSYENAGSVLKK